MALVLFDGINAPERVMTDAKLAAAYYWNAHTVSPMAIESALLRGRDPAPHKELQGLYLLALAGEKVSAEKWIETLKVARADAYGDVYSPEMAETDVYAQAWARTAADIAARDALYGGVFDDIHEYQSAHCEIYLEAYPGFYDCARKRLEDGMEEASRKTADVGAIAIEASPR